MENIIQTEDSNAFVLTLTEAAQKKMRTSVQKRSSGFGVRIGVKTTGCSGLAYVLEFVDTPCEYDLQQPYEGFVLCVDPKSAQYLRGTVIDYERVGLNEGFSFKNPLERDRCGCGESFRV